MQTNLEHRTWGYVFELTDEHFTEETARPLRYTYDVLASDCLERLNEISPPPRSALPRNNPVEPPSATTKDSNPSTSTPVAPSASPRRDTYALLRDNADKDPKLQELWKQVNTIPEWVDWDSIGRGQDVFYRYGGPAVTGLAYQSLLGGTTAVIPNSYTRKYC